MAEPPDSGQVVSANSPELSTPPLGHVAPLGMFVSAKFQPLGARSLHVLQLLRVPDQPGSDSLQPELMSAQAELPIQTKSETTSDTPTKSNPNPIAIQPTSADSTVAQLLAAKAPEVNGDRVVPSSPALINRSPNPPGSWASIAQLMGEDEPATVQRLAADGSGSVSETSTEQMIFSETTQIEASQVEKNQAREVQAKEAIALESPSESFSDPFPDQFFQLHQPDFFQRDKDSHKIGHQIEYSSASDRDLLAALSTRLEGGDTEFLADLAEVMQSAQREFPDRLSPELPSNHALGNDASEILEQLAQEMYQALQHRLVLERERQGNLYSGRLPW